MLKRSEWRGRYLLLAFDCMLVVGIYFCTDIPSALQSHIEGTETVNCTDSGNANNVSSTCCVDCLGLGSDRYNLLYTISSWTSAAMVLPVGFFIDKMGNRVSALLFTGIASAGSILFAMGSLSSIRGTGAMFPLMMAGRLLLGAGTGPSRIVRDRILAYWFRDKLSLAFGIAVSTMGMGSVCTFVLTSTLAEWIGLMPTMFVGAAVCSTTFLSAICVCVLDWYGCRTIAGIRKLPIQLKRQSTATVKPTSFVATLKSFPAAFWVIAIMTATYYSFQLPFTANGTKFIQERYGYKRTDASYMNGILYDVSVVLSPIAGIIMEKLGKRSWIAFMGSLLTVPVGAFFLFTDMHPIVGFVWLGVMFTFTVVSLWASIPYTVSSSSLGTANGVASFMLDAFTGLTSLGIGQIMTHWSPDSEYCSQTGWKFVFLVLFGLATICAISGLVLNTCCGEQNESSTDKTIVTRQCSFGPMHVDDGQCSYQSSSSSDVTPSGTMSRDSSSADLVAVMKNSLNAELGAGKFMNYKATLPRGVKVKVGGPSASGDKRAQVKIQVDNVDPLHVEIIVPATTVSFSTNKDEQCDGEDNLSFDDVDKGQDNLAFDDISIDDELPCKYTMRDRQS